MKHIKSVPVPDIVYNLRKLSETAKAVAYASSPEEAELLTVNHLRPLLLQVEKVLEGRR